MKIMLLSVGGPLWGPDRDVEPELEPRAQRAYDRADVVIGLDPKGRLRTLKGSEHVDTLIGAHALG